MEKGENEILPPNFSHFSGTLNDLFSEIDLLFKSKKAVVFLVDFFAEWCGPCRRLGKLLPKIAEKYSKIHFFKINVDENREISRHFSVHSLPTIKFFIIDDGKLIEVSHLVGCRPDEITEICQKLLVGRKPEVTINNCKYDYDHPCVKTED